MDTTDKLAKEFTTQRKSNRWPMAIFFHLLDIGGINAYKLWMLKNPDWKKNRLDRRRMFLLELGQELIRKNIIRRYQNDKSLHSNIKQSMLTTLPELNIMNEQPVIGRKQRCFLCDRSKDRKSRKVCIRCNQFVCAEHSKNITVCNKCDN